MCLSSLCLNSLVSISTLYLPRFIPSYLSFLSPRLNLIIIVIILIFIIIKLFLSLSVSPTLQNLCKLSKRLSFHLSLSPLTSKSFCHRSWTVFDSFVTNYCHRFVCSFFSYKLACHNSNLHLVLVSSENIRITSCSLPPYLMHWKWIISTSQLKNDLLF